MNEVLRVQVLLVLVAYSTFATWRHSFGSSVTRTHPYEPHEIQKSLSVPGKCRADQWQCLNLECVNAYYVCDGNPDCSDRSDEQMGCLQPAIVQPPVTNIEAQLGSTFQLSCRAAAVPEAYITWHHNRGPVCRPPRCTQHSEGGFGTITITNAQIHDEGAYTCEAINVNGRAIATPDCIVRIVKFAIPPPRLTCKTGAITPGPTTESCQCKELVTGAECDRCSTGAYNINEKLPQGCLKCFCFGITQNCRPSTWFRKELKLIFPRKARAVILVCTDERNVSTNVRFQFHYPGMVSYTGSEYRKCYWKLPQQFLGNKITAYGGKMAFELQHSCTGRFSSEHLIIIKGNRLTLVHRPKDVRHILTARKKFQYSFETYEHNYEHLDGSPAKREDLMMVLADLNAFLIRATHCDGQQFTSLADVTWEIAVDRNTEGSRAPEVEQCTCPTGYLGTSCEVCAPGYFRTGSGLYLGSCEKCECNGHSSQCDKKTGFCINCLHNTEGYRCERCKAGFEGEARRGTPTDCQLGKPPPLCDCNGHSRRGCDPFGRCLLCEHNTEGIRCEKCKNGFYGTATRGTPHDCKPCPCLCPPTYARMTVQDYSRYLHKMHRMCNTYRTCAILKTFTVKIDEPKNLTVPEGYTASWYCRAFNYLNQTVHLEWSKLGANSLPPKAKAGGGFLTIENVRREDAGIYKCSANQYDYAHLTVEFAPVVDPRVQTIPEGSAALVQCRVPGNPNAILTFRKQGGTLPVNSVELRGVLLIQRSALHDAGNYICSAKYLDRPNEPEVDSLPAKINIKRRPLPTPEVDPIVQTVVEHNPALISCTVPGRPDALLHWAKQKGKLSAGARAINGVFYILRTSLQDTGYYICHARDPESPEQQLVASIPARINVIPSGPPQMCKPPTVVVEPREWKGEPGNSHKFYCKVTGAPASIVTWSGPHGELPADVRMMDEGKTLYFEKGRMALNGDYTCIATNECGMKNGTATSTATVEIDPGIEILISPPGPKITVVIGQPLEVRCNASVPVGDPEPYAEWVDTVKERDDLPSNFKPPTIFGQYLRHPQMGLMNAGKYICRGWNELVEKEKEIEIAVLGPVGVAILGSSEQRLQPKREVELYCVVVGPLIVDRLEWGVVDGLLPIGADNQSTPGVLHFPDFRPEYEGEYECRGYRNDEMVAIQKVHVYSNGGDPSDASHVEIDGPLIRAVQQGNSLSLTCIVKGESYGTKFAWSLLRQGTLVQMQSENGGLEIAYADPHNDDGVYRCVAEDDKGKELGAAYVAVVVGYTRKSQVILKEFDEGVNATIECPLFVVPRAKFVWGREDGVMPEGTTYSENKLNILSFDSAKQGTYRCEMKVEGQTIEGFVTAQIREVQLAIVAAPEPPIVGSGTYFDCKVTGSEPAFVTWSKEGEDGLPDNAQVVGVRLQFTDLHENNTGTYKCTAKTAGKKILEARTVMNLSSGKHKRKRLSQTTGPHRAISAKNFKSHQSSPHDWFNFLVKPFASFFV